MLWKSLKLKIYLANNDPYCKIRLSILLNKIHKELADSYDACIEIPKEYIPSCMFKAMNEHILKENGNDNQKNLQKSESCIKSEVIKFKI